MGVTVTFEEPFLRSTLDASTTAEELPKLFEQIRAFYEAPHRHISVMDVSISPRVGTALVRSEAAAFMKEMTEASAEWCAASAIIVRSPIMAGAIRAVFWMAPPKFPYAVFSDRDKAEAWLSEQKLALFSSSAP